MNLQLLVETKSTFFILLHFYYTRYQTIPQQQLSTSS
jgi:hypothetical protein